MLNSENTPNDFNQLNMGDVFTPNEWAIFAIKQFGIFDSWINGARVFDPTMGDGALLKALVNVGVEKGYSINELPTHRLFGNEINTQYYRTAVDSFLSDFGIDMSSNFSNADVFTLNKNSSFDILLGNPPWVTFANLPEEYKSYIKGAFVELNLVNNRKDVLLGGSRIDLAALVVQKAMSDLLSPAGEAFFFLPLSLFLNDGANALFRSYTTDHSSFSLATIIDFKDEVLFDGVATRYGIAHFKNGDTTSYPIPYLSYEKGAFTHYLAKPLFSLNDPLSVYRSEDQVPLHNFVPIALNRSSQPRQGINTSGANALFFFKAYQQLDNGLCLVNETILLPQQFVFPLLTSSNFKDESKEVPKKWVLLPYDPTTGKPLDWSVIEEFDELKRYLTIHKDQLSKRKGAMIQSMIKRGHWWSLLGVGQYCFSPFKVVWEAYGKSTFNPRIISSDWQVNQSLQAYIPVNTHQEAQRVLDALLHPSIEHYLLSLKMEGTMNWAQPGKIKKLIEFTD